jgi:hypothetical protein
MASKANFTLFCWFPELCKKNIFIQRTNRPAPCIYSQDKKGPQFAPWRPDIPAKERIMLAKCANPTCSTPLVYLREGKIFMVEAPQPQFELLTAPSRPKATNRVEHFWLCGPCSSDMTLTYDRERGIEIVRKTVGKAPLVRRAAAS